MFEYLNDQWVEETQYWQQQATWDLELWGVFILAWPGHSGHVTPLSLSLSWWLVTRQTKKRFSWPQVLCHSGEGHKISSIDFETRSVFDYGKVKSMVLFSAWHITWAWKDKEL